MATAAELKKNVKVVMFDQYGTVVDMQGGLTEVVTPYLKEKGWNGRPDAFVTWWRRTHFENSMIDALLSLSFNLHAHKGTYALLLGSGISRSAGISTGWEITLDMVSRLAHLQQQDCRVDPAENIFPMIPSGAAHNEMILGELDEISVSDAGKMMV